MQKISQIANGRDSRNCVTVLRVKEHTLTWFVYYVLVLDLWYVTDVCLVTGVEC